MPLTTYVAGDVLTASSLNDNFTFAAANPPATPGGLTFITGGSFTTATSFSLANGTFSASHQNYKIIVQLSATATDSTMTVRMRTGGSDSTASSYDTMLVGILQGGTAANLSGNQQSSFKAGVTRAGRFAFVADIITPFATGFTRLAVNTVTRENTGNVGRSGYYVFDATTSFDSLSLIGSAASSLTGTFKVYGYADS